MFAKVLLIAKKLRKLTMGTTQMGETLLELAVKEDPLSARVFPGGVV
jgi:hypothetical protein